MANLEPIDLTALSGAELSLADDVNRAIKAWKEKRPVAQLINAACDLIDDRFNPHGYCHSYCLHTLYVDLPMGEVIAEALGEVLRAIRPSGWRRDEGQPDVDEENGCVRLGIVYIGDAVERKVRASLHLSLGEVSLEADDQEPVASKGCRMVKVDEVTVTKPVYELRCPGDEEVPA